MQRTKFLALAAVLVLVAGAFFGVLAQKRNAMHKIPSPPLPPINAGLSGTYATDVEATEINAGEPNEVAGGMYGWTISGTTKGDLTGFIFLSVNYANSVVPVDVIGDLLPPPTNDITGGSWTKLIFVDGVYQGSVSGTITSGTMTFNQKTRTSSLSLKLVGDKGTEAYAASAGTGTFEGTVSRIDQQVATISGALTLNY